PEPVLGKPARHLHEAVEAATVRPRSRRTIGREAADDEPGSQGTQSRRGIAETAQGAGPVAVDDDVGGASQTLEGGPISCKTQIESSASPAAAPGAGAG